MILTLKVYKKCGETKRKHFIFFPDGEIVVQTISNLSINFLLEVYMCALNLLVVRKNIRRKNI